MLKYEVGRKWRQIRWNDVFERKITADKYFMRSGLIRKDVLGLYAQKWMPETYLVNDYDQLKKIVENSMHMNWVLKLCDSSNAYGIHFFGTNDADKMLCVLEDKQKRVLQQCICPWLTIDRRKFHLRVLVLAVVGDLDVYVYHDVRVLIATKAYCEWNMSDPFVHITNQSTNKEHEEYDEDNQNISIEMLAQHGLDVNSIKKQISTIIAGIFQQVTQSKNRRHFFSLPNCYELFGFDFMIDSTGKALVLEVNPDPCLSMFHEKIVLPRDMFNDEIPQDLFTHVFSLDKMKVFSVLKSMHQPPSKEALQAQ